MPGRVALPTGGNPATTSGLINFQLPDSAGAGTPQTIIGVTVAETTGSAGAKVRFHDGTTSGAPILLSEIELATGTDREIFPPNGLEVNSGSVYLEVISGSVEVTVEW